MLTMAKIFKQFFTSTLNGIAVSDRIIQAKRRKPKTAFSEVEHRHDSPVAIQTLHALTSLLYICYNEHIGLCKLIETYIYGSRKHPFTSYSTAKHPKHSQLNVTNIQEKLVIFQSSPAGERRQSPQKRCLFRFFCKSFHSCSIYGSVLQASVVSYSMKISEI